MSLFCDVTDDRCSQVLRVVEGHNQSVLHIHLTAHWMATCSADEDVRVWSVKQKTKATLLVDTTLRLQGHDTAVTCVRYSKLEVMWVECLLLTPVSDLPLLCVSDSRWCRAITKVTLSFGGLKTVMWCGGYTECTAARCTACNSTRHAFSRAGRTTTCA